MGPPAGASRGADSRGFLSALFDFSFTSFVTTRIIKVLYVLITVLVSLAALVYTIIAFRISTAFGLLVLVIGDPLYIIIVMAFWRLVLEAFVVVFRIAEDVRGSASAAAAEASPGHCSAIRNADHSACSSLMSPGLHGRQPCGFDGTPVGLCRGSASPESVVSALVPGALRNASQEAVGAMAAEGREAVGARAAEGREFRDCYC